MTTQPVPRGVKMAIGATTIDIIQDHEFDEDSGVGAPMLTFWAEGHGHDAAKFIRAVVDYTLDNDGSVPRIDPDDEPVEMWQRIVEREGGVEYSRRPKNQDSSCARVTVRAGWEPITVLDLERRGRGGTKCGVKGCAKPWSAGMPAIVRIETDNRGPTVDGSYMTVLMWFCREHQNHFPAPSYRVCMVPVGATILLPAPEQENTDDTQDTA